MAELLSRHGHVLRDAPESTKADDGPRGLPARWRRALIALGCVVAAGSVLGGAVAVGNAGHETPLGPVPGGLLDQLTRGSTGDDPRSPHPGDPVLPEEPLDRPDPVGILLPRNSAVAPAAAAVPAPPKPPMPGPVDRVPAPVAPAPGAGGGPVADRDDPEPEAGSDRAVVPEETEPDVPSERSAPDTAEPAPAPAAPEPVQPSRSGGPVGDGLLGGATDAVGGLLGG